MAKPLSAGILLYRLQAGALQVFLVHPGGPFWQRKDVGAWSIPKGEFAAGEDPLEAAKREFQEETVLSIEGTFTELKPIKQRGGKMVCAWAVAADFDASQVKSNTFTIEWPPKSGKQTEFPEVDLGEWFDMNTAIEKINEGQRELLTQLNHILMV